MGLFGKIFEKKICDICGGEIGLLGNRKLEDGNMCKTCAAKLSPWFSERRQSTVEQIKDQLEQREGNKASVAAFQTTRSIGERMKVLIDENTQQFMVTSARNIIEANPDVIPLSLVTGCTLNIDEDRRELKREDRDGNMVSYNPPRYVYSYDFEMCISVRMPYFDEIKFDLNDTRVEIENISSTRMGMGRFTPTGINFNPEHDPEYRRYKQMGEEIRVAILSGREKARSPEAPTEAPAAAPTAPAAPAGPWNCPACGGQNSGKFCEFCGSPRPNGI